MKTELVAPHMDKGWSFQVTASEPFTIDFCDIRGTLLSLMDTPIARRARPFLQSDCSDFLMVEFWTDDEKVIAETAAFFENGLV